MFGNLFHVNSPVLVDRYNRALEHLTGRTTQLDDFHIDISGYAPEIGEEFDDHLYLNHDGVNRQFILLSTEQRRAPLLNMQLSTSRGILQQFITANENQLFALTARDAVAGELVNSVFRLDHPSRLLDLGEVTIEADTTQGVLQHAQQLAGKVEDFKTREDAWFDDALIGDMIDLAQTTGDVARNPVQLKHTRFSQKNYWAAHLGGLYLFPDAPNPAVLHSDALADLDGLGLEHIALQNRNHVAHFLELNGLAEPIVKARGVDAAAILRQKLDFILVDALAGQDVGLRDLDRTDTRRLARANPDLLPPEYDALNALYNWTVGRARWPRIASDHPAYFYTLRAADHADADLVNMLLAELAPLDVRQLFICHKPLFYDLYRQWPEAKKEYVSEFLAREYAVDKVGARAALFGHEPAMQPPAPPPRKDDLIARVGPWGALRRK